VPVDAALARETGAKTADDVLRIAEQVIGGNLGTKREARWDSVRYRP
jgi:hypothetical protein